MLGAAGCKTTTVIKQGCQQKKWFFFTNSKNVSVKMLQILSVKKNLVGVGFV